MALWGVSFSRLTVAETFASSCEYVVVDFKSDLLMLSDLLAQGFLEILGLPCIILVYNTHTNVNVFHLLETIWNFSSVKLRTVELCQRWRDPKNPGEFREGVAKPSGSAGLGNRLRFPVEQRWWKICNNFYNPFGAMVRKSEMFFFFFGEPGKITIKKKRKVGVPKRYPHKNH